jgi:hypothetical protein
LLYLIRYWLWEFSEKRFIAESMKRDDILPPSVACEHLPEDENSGILIPGPKRPAEASGEQTAAEIPGSARHEHDKKREIPGGYPPSGHKNPELPHPALSAPRKPEVKAKPSGENEYTEISSWNCACI